LKNVAEKAQAENITSSQAAEEFLEKGNELMSK